MKVTGLISDDKSTLVQVMAWCRQATSHYLSQCWPRSLSPYDVTRPQWVKPTSAFRNVPAWCSRIMYQDVLRYCKINTLMNIPSRGYVTVWTEGMPRGESAVTGPYWPPHFGYALEQSDFPSNFASFSRNSDLPRYVKYVDCSIAPTRACH